MHGQLIELEKSLEKVARVANPGFAIKLITRFTLI